MEAKGKKKLNQVVRSIAGREWGARAPCLRTTYLATVRPHLEYGVPVWAHAAKSNLDKLDKIQYAAGRIITGATRSTSTDYVEHEAELIPLNKQRDEIMLKYGSRLKSLPEEHINDLITKWQKISRLKQSSPLELYSDLVTI